MDIIPIILMLTPAMTAWNEKRYRVFLVCAHILGLIVICRLGADALAGLACGPGNRIALNFAYHASYGNAEVLYNLALRNHYSLTKPEPGRAVRLYRLAVGRDPFYAPAWYQLALACRLTGRDREADEAIRRYEALGHSYAADLWNIGVFRLEEGEAEQAAADFKKCIELNPGFQAGVSGLYLLMNTPQIYMAEKVLPRTRDAYSRHLDYLLASGKADDALTFIRLAGNRHTGGGLIARDRAASLCRLLIKNGRYAEAWDFWRQFFSGGQKQKQDDARDAAIINGGFEEPVAASEEACFGWVAQQAPGLAISYDVHNRTEGKRGLHIRFDGSRGPGLQIWQYVRVSPNRSYELKADVKAKNVSTAGGVFLEVWNQECGGFYTRGAALRGTVDWREVSLAFRAPAGCRLLKVGIARDAALKLDPTVQSGVWIDNVEIARKNKNKNKKVKE